MLGSLLIARRLAVDSTEQAEDTVTGVAGVELVRNPVGDLPGG